jgi:hypothetical protein
VALLQARKFSVDQKDKLGNNADPTASELPAFKGKRRVGDFIAEASREFVQIDIAGNIRYVMS